MFTSNNRRRAAMLALSATLTLGAIACGGDDDSADDAPTTTAAAATDTPDETVTDNPATTVAASADLAASCDQYTQVSGALAGLADPATAGPLLEEFAAGAPEQIKEQAAAVSAGLQTAFGGDDSVFGDAEFISALSTAGGFFVDNCDLAARYDVTGADYAFSGLDAEVPAGRVGIRFINISEGNEPHELILARRPDGDTRTVEEIAALTPDVLFGEYQMAGVVFTDVPSQTMSILVDLEPGSYVAMCTLPTMGEETVPHAHHGMIAAIEVA